MKKLFTLLTLALLSIGTAWATIGDTFTVTFNGSDSQTTANYFSFSGNHNFNSKFTGATYDNVTYTSGLKMEGNTIISWTQAAEATVIILQSDWESKTVAHGTPKSNKLDGTEIPVANATSGTGYKLYTIENVAAGNHSITRNGGENGIFMVRVIYTGESQDVVANPQITWNSGTSQATITCSTDGATIYYTTDGSEPTTSSATYSSAIPLTNSTTVRAFAKKGDASSNIVTCDCYVSHASVDKYLTTLGYNGGTVSGDVWTGTNFTITNNVADGGINYVNLAGSQDGFKLNHTATYTIQPSEGIKVTKLVVVGKTWLKGDASTIAFDGWTPASGTFFECLTGGETYVKTIEFTPSTEQTYGQAITMTPGNNQLGAYIEVYGDIKTYDVTYAAGANGTGTIAAGEKKHGIDFKLSSSKFTRDGFEQTGWATSDGGPQVYALGGTYTGNTAITLYPVWSVIVSNVTGSWDFTNWSNATKTDVLANTEKWNQYERTDNGGTNFGDNGRSNVGALSNNTLTSTATISEANGLKFTAGAYGLGLMFNMPSTEIGTYHGSQYIWLYSNGSTIKIQNVPANAVIEIGVESHKDSEARGVTLKNGSTTLTQTQGEATSKTYQVCKWTNTSTVGDVVVTPTKGLHIYYITVTENIEKIPVSTIADRNYATCVATKKLDFSAAEGITAYIATGLNGDKDAVVLEPVNVVPAGTPIIVKTETQGATVNVPVTTADADDVSANKLVAGDGTTSGTAGTYYYLANDLFHLAESGTLQTGKAYLSLPSSAPSLGIVFDNLTGISATLMNSEKVKGGIYDLQGRKIMNPAKGLYIVNGKKVIIK